MMRRPADMAAPAVPNMGELLALVTKATIDVSDEMALIKMAMQQCNGDPAGTLALLRSIDHFNGLVFDSLNNAEEILANALPEKKEGA